MPIKIRPAILAAIVCAAHAVGGQAQDIAARPGWSVVATQKSYDGLIADLKDAVKAHGMIVVTQAGPTRAAAARGIDIPGNRVIGVFNNDFAVRVLDLSVAAMIEAPIRFYVTENADATASLSYKRPSVILAPYLDAGGDALAAIAGELDGIFAAISNAAVTSRD